jgi:hypothetical protein
MRSRSSEQAPTSAPHPYTGISTERIMRAVEQQRRITSQLDGLQARQRARLARIGAKIVFSLFMVAIVISVGLLALFLFQPDLFLAILAFSSGAIDFVMQLGHYLSGGLVLITSQSWLLAGAALVVVLMISLWLCLMRAPHEA